MRKFFTTLTALAITALVSAPDAGAQNRGRGRGNGSGSRPRTELSRPSTPSRPGSGYRPGNSGRPDGYLPGNNGGHKPGGGGNNDNGFRPGGGSHKPDGGNNDNGFRPGGGSHKPGGGNNNGFRPGGGSHKPGGNGHRPDHGFRPPHDHYRPGHWRPMPRPPYRPYMPAYRPWRPPVRPVGFRPYVGCPNVVSILGVIFGTSINLTLDALYNNGYNIAGYMNNAIYLTNVSLMNVMWPNVTLSYSNGGLRGSEFTYSSPGYDMSRYNIIYNQLYRQYGSPVSTDANGPTVTTTWWGYDNGYIRLSFFPDYAYNGSSRYYTTLSIGN